MMRFRAEDIEFARRVAADRPHWALVYDRLEDSYIRIESADFDRTRHQIVFDPNDILMPFIEKKDGDLIRTAFDHDQAEKLLTDMAFVRLLDDMYC